MKTGTRRSAWSCAAVLAFALGATPAWGQGQPDPAPLTGHKVVRVQMRSAADAKVMSALSNDPWTCRWGGEVKDAGGSAADFRVSPEAFEALQQSGLSYSVLIDDVQALIDAETARLSRPARGPGWYSDFKDLAAVNAQLDAWIAARPTMVSRVTIGNSVQGRSIPCVRIAAPGTPVNSKPQVVVIGCQHAREWITVMGTMYFADQLVNQSATSTGVQRLLNSFEFYVIPVVNPDGYVYTWPTTLGGGGQRLWRKNRRDNGGGVFGVDLNRNWDFRWGGVGTSSSPSSDIYRGTAAFSEPESSNIGAFASTLPNLVMFYDVHCYSQFILEPWGDTFTLPPDTRSFAQMSGRMQNAMFASDGKTYVAGPGFRVIYATTGVADEWAYGARGALGLAFELRDTGQFGFVLPADQILPASQELYAGLDSSLNWMIDNTLSVEFPSSRPTRVPAGGSTSVLVQFQQGLRKVGNFATTPPTLSVRQGRVGTFTTTNLTSAGTDETGQVFSHTLSGGACGSIVQWYYSVPLSDGSIITIPSTGAAKPFEAVANQFTSVIAGETFEAPVTGWSTTDVGDTTTPAAWVRGDPNGTQSQVEFDHTPLTGVNCFYTGQNTRGDTFGIGRVGESSTGANQSQKTTLISPVLNLGTATTAEVNFWLAYANSRQFSPDDAFSVDATFNAAAATPTWTNILTIAANGPVGETTVRWNRYSLRLNNPSGLGSNVRVRFVAREDGNGDAVEAAMDDFSVLIPVCEKTPCVGDFNGDSVAGVQDIFDFLAAWFNSSPLTDVDNSGSVSTQDLFTFLASWFAGCP